MLKVNKKQQKDINVDMYNIPTHITLRDPMNIKISTDDYDRMEMLRDEFNLYTDGFRFSPAYKSGKWNGKISLIRRDGSLPYGLLIEFIRSHKKLFPRAKLIVDDDVKDIFKGKPLNIKQDLTITPYPFQLDCIQKALKYTKGIIRSSTASGKSAIISYILKTLLENNIINKGIIVVPNKSLVDQFHSDMIDYGISDRYSVGRVYQKSKEWDEDIVVSTWQTLQNNHHKLPNYECIIIDETHHSKSFQLRKILAKSVSAQYRLGFTGTLHSGQLDNFNTFAYLGPIIADYSSGELADKGYISSCTVKMINIQYNDEYEGTYDEVKDQIFQNEYRLNMMKQIISGTDDNILILVGKVEKEGDFLRDWLSLRLKGKEIVFLSGRDDAEVREKWRKSFDKRKDICLIATYGIFSTGINIPSLKHLILGSPFKSKIRVLQSIGRSLRKHASKEDGSYIYDICDDTKYFAKHSVIRSRYYDSEGFDIEDIVLREGDVYGNGKR